MNRAKHGRSRTALVLAATLMILVASPVSAGFWESDDKVDLSFRGTFSKAPYEKSYFGWVILGTSIVAAAAISYVTAGAGAPAAATGVSTVASVIGGGGAGSYMAGLSAIGGWVGGNAMVGAALLNGVALGLGGGGAAFGTLSAVGKVAVLSSVTATALDGVLIFYPQDTRELTYRIRLAVPSNVGSKAIQDLAREFSENEKSLLEAATNKNGVKWKAADDARKALVYKVNSRGAEAIKPDANTSPEDLLVLGVLAKNAGETELGNRLIHAIPSNQLSYTGYVDYLRAVIQVENGKIEAAKKLLVGVRQSDPYAIEPALLLLNLLGHRDFEKNKAEIMQLADATISDFDDDEYKTNYGLLAFRYRVASMYFQLKDYDKAETWYDKAYKEVPFTQKLLFDKQIGNLVLLGKANSIYLQGDKTKANSLMNDILDDAGSFQEKVNLVVQYAGFGSQGDDA